MIKAVLFKGPECFTGFELSGHAEFAEEGSDIVCAAVSACAQFAIAGISETEKISCGYEISDGRIYLTLPKDISKEDMAKTEGYLKTLQCVLKQLSEQYNEFLNFSCLEV